MRLSQFEADRSTRPHPGIGVAALALLLASAAAGCSELGHGCTDVGCGPTLLVRVPSASKMPNGTYRVELSSSLGPLATECTIVDSAINCVPLTPIATGYVSVTRDTPTGLIVDATGYAPVKFTVTVRLGTTTLVNETLTPTYSESHPNGPTCEPTCRSATVTTKPAP